MTDFFSLLDQPRRPWLDLEKLKQAFHEKSRRAHPDARTPGADPVEAEAAFTQLNTAYQVLQDPKRRLQHLLTLEGKPPTDAGCVIAPDIADLFQSVAGASQDAGGVLQELSGASNPLSRSLLHLRLISARARLTEVLVGLLSLQAGADEELKALSDSASATPEDRVRELERLYARFAYLSRWIGELEEKKTELSTH